MSKHTHTCGWVGVHVYVRTYVICVIYVLVYVTYTVCTYVCMYNMFMDPSTIYIVCREFPCQHW